MPVLTGIETTKIIEVFSEYREFARDSAIYDENGRINGDSERAYYLKGIQEELDEIIQGPTEKDNFDRFLALVEGNTGNVLQTERQQKEFGDTFWYLANFYNYYEIDTESAVKQGAKIIQENDFRPVGREEYSDYIYENYPWLEFILYSRRLSNAVEAIWENRPMSGYTADEIRAMNLLVDKEIGSRNVKLQNISKEGGAFIIASSQLLSVSFDTSLEEILDQNRNKLIKRAAEGTIFGSGDDR